MNKHFTTAVDSEGPSSSKKARVNVDLNDSFYDSEEDELVSQACEKASSKVPQNSFVNQSAPRTPIISTPRLQKLPASATTLKGKPLTPSNSFTLAADDDPTIIHTSKPFFRLAKEVKELNEERDTLKGQSLFLEQSLRVKEKESQDQLLKIAELTQKYTDALEEVREVQRRADEEIVQLRTQLQFQTEQTKAGTFLSDKSNPSNKDVGSENITDTPMNTEVRPVLTAVQNVPKIKPRMSTSSVNKSFSSSVLKPRSTTPLVSRSVGQQINNADDAGDAFIPDFNDENATKEKVEKGIQTDSFRLGDLITDPNILAKRETYDAILNTMIGASFIIDEENGVDSNERSHKMMSEIVDAGGPEPTLNDILNKS